MAEPGNNTQATRVFGATGQDWFVPPAQLAELALGGTSSRQNQPHHSLGRHLAYLPLESLELDLNDPMQSELGDYALLARIGQGGMGVVYRAHQRSLDRQVAIKLLAAGPWASPEFIERFRREAQAAARMQHPNIVAIHEVGACDGLNYFCMQLVRGESLAALLARERRLDPRWAARLVRTIAEAVDYAHRLGVLHLDLKPGNVLLDERGEPLVADFGLARRLDEALPGDSDEVCGTPSYMAPEQAMADARLLQPATDVYGLGAILYELLTGQPPFHGSSPQATLKLVVVGELQAARKLLPALPADLDAICTRCLAKDGARRYPSARALADDLLAFLDDRATTVRPLAALERVRRWARRQPLQAAMAAMLTLTFFAGFAATSLQWQRAENNASSARTLLWESRRLEANRLAVEGRGFEGAALLLANIEDSEAAGRRDAGNADRRRLGTLLAQGVQLIDRIMIDDASPTAAELSDDGSVLAVGFNDLSVRWYDTASFAEQGRVGLMGVRTSEEMGDFHRVPSMLRFVPGNRLKVSLEWYEHWIRPGERDTSLIDLSSATHLALPPGFDDASISADGGYAILHNGGQAQLWQTTPWRALGPTFEVPHPPLPTLLTRGGRYGLSLAPSMASFQLRDPRAPQRELALELPKDAGLGAWAESADGRWLAIGDHSGRLHLIDLDTLQARRLSQVLRDEITSLAFSEDDQWLAAGNSNGSAMVFDVASGVALLPDSLLHDFPISRMRLVRSQQLLVVIGMEQVALWRLPLPGSLGHRAHRLHTGPTPLPGAAPYAVGLSADTGLLASAAMTGEIRLWRIPTSPLLAARGAALTPEQPITDGQRLAEVAYDRLRLVDLDGRFASDWISLPEPPSFAEVLPQARELLVVSGQELRLYNADSLHLKHTLSLPGAAQRLLATADESLIVVSVGGSEPGRGFVETLLLVDRRRGALLSASVTLDGPLSLRAAADSERLLAIGPSDGATQMFALPSLQRIGSHAHDLDAPVANGGFAADQRTAILVERAPDPVAADDALLLWDPAAHTRPLRRLLPGLLPVAVTAIGGQIYVGGAHRDLLLAAGQIDRAVIRLSRAEATAPVAASADGHWLARAFRYRDIELIDPVSGSPLGPALFWNPGGIQLLSQLAFTADGSALLARSSQGRRLRWPLAMEQREVNVVRRHLHPLLAATPEEPMDVINDPGARRLLRSADSGPWPRLSSAAAPLALRHVDGEPVPPRSAAATPWMLDLSAAYSLAPTGNWGPRDHVVASIYPLPWGLQRLAGVDYDIRGAVGLNAPSGPDAANVRRSRVTGIKVPAQRVAAFHMLLLAANRSVEPAQREYARLRLHYADGGETTVPLLTGRDVPGYAGSDADVPVAWEYGLHLRLLGQPLFLPLNNPRLPNPHPERIVSHIDVESGTETWNAPVIIAITAEPVIGVDDCCKELTERRPPTARPK